MRWLAAVLFLIIAAEAQAAESKPDAAVPAKPIEPLPVETADGLTRHVRALQLVQDRMATGGQIAIDAQRAILVQLASGLATQPPNLDLPQTRQMLALALLNGIDPSAVRAALAKNISGAADGVTQDAFLAGALAYAEGRLPQARAQFAAVDDTMLPSARGRSSS
ncbi:MAG: hypothetical protein HC779_06995 [Phyllobacteriaceae bacterium]|nr:hypothetical protein [Phyllobacteriaceae bacterium]